MVDQEKLKRVYGKRILWEGKLDCEKKETSKYQPHQGKRERARRKSNANV